MVTFAESTRSSAEAAAAIGCTVARMPNTVFALTPAQLVAMTGGTVAAIAG